MSIPTLFGYALSFLFFNWELNFSRRSRNVGRRPVWKAVWKYAYRFIGIYCGIGICIMVTTFKTRYRLVAALVLFVSILPISLLRRNQYPVLFSNICHPSECTLGTYRSALEMNRLALQYRLHLMPWTRYIINFVSYHKEERMERMLFMLFVNPMHAGGHFIALSRLRNPVFFNIIV